MKRNEIHIRDPFILPFEGKYYLFGTSGAFAWEGAGGFLCYISEDLENWSEPIKCFDAPKDFWADTNYWAPEVHIYNGKFYMFASFYVKDKSRNRATQILVSDKPEGPFTVWSEPITPAEWMCLDGTFYVEDGIPYMIFCHEWVQVHDGEMCAVQLSEDLKKAVGEPRLLFKASEPCWACKETKGGFVTDGPFMYKTRDGKLLMIWSSFDKNGYVEAVAYSDNGRLSGNWKHCNKLFFENDGGHGMIFESFDKKKYFVMHSPNTGALERPILLEICETENEPYLEVL